MSEQRDRWGGDASIDGPARSAAIAPGRSTASARLASGAMLRRKARDASGVAANADEAVASASSSSGAPLPEDVRGRFESSLGTDLSAVRVHTSAASTEAAFAVGAKAYTIGNDIHFGAGQYAPADPFGIHLLAHEVAHTQQQAGGASRRTQFKLEVSEPGDAHELEADRAADAMVTGAPAHVSEVAGIARKVSRKIDLALARVRFKKEFLPRAGGDKDKAKQLYIKELGGPANWDDAIIEPEAPPPAAAPAPAPSAPVPQPDADELDGIMENGKQNGGVVTKDVPKAGDSPELPMGTYVQKLGDGAKAGTLSVYAFSGIDRKRDMESDAFRPEPSLRHEGKEHAPHDVMDDAIYQESHKPLWGEAGPQPHDALSQDVSGDCYFLSAVAAVCQSHQQAIMDLFDPKTPASTYTITLYKRQGKADELTPVKLTVDAYLPSTHDGHLKYGGWTADPGIWVPLIEKAWAMYTGSYDNMGGGCSEFSHPGTALEALTGNTSGKVAHDSMFLMGRLQSLATANRAVTVGMGKKTDKNKAVFEEYGLTADHQYLFVGMAGSDAVNLKNPWGYDDPKKPLTAAAINAVVNDISYAAVPGAESHDPYNKDCQDATGSDAPECSTGGGGGGAMLPRTGEDGAGGARP